MARRSIARTWGLALWGLCLLAVTSGPARGPGRGVADSAPPAAVALVSAAADAAVLPARAADEVRVAASASPLRTMVLAAVLAALAGLPALLRHPSRAAGAHHQPLRARRHSIALRAPPLQSA